MTRKALSALFALLLASTSAFAAFREGPEILSAPLAQKPGALITAPVKEVASGQADFDKAALALAKEGRDLLLVGHTDAFGPKLLNQWLGLQYAVTSAYALSARLDIDLSRITCATMGESVELGVSGVSLYSQEPKPPEKTEPPTMVTVLSPTPGGEVGPEFQALWENDAKTVYWGREEDDSTMLWRIVTPKTPFSMPYPALAGRIALGADFGDDQGVGEAGWPMVKSDPAMTLTVQSLETGWAVVTGKLPAGSRDAYVWAGGIPYPITAEGGRFYAPVANFGVGMLVYAQAVDSRGRVAISPVLTLPENPEGDPKVIAVLTWEGDKVDLDLHGWRGAGHTQPQDPDPTMSGSAAKGVRLLFDGDGRSRASALIANDEKDLEVEVRAFSDLGGGAKATLFVVTDPGDRIMRRGRIIGPREIQGEYMWSRWCALNMRGGK